MFNRWIAVMLLATLLAGCAGNAKKLSRAEWLSTTSRTYTGVEKEHVILAAEKLMRLSDGNDYQIQHTDDGLYATRRWSIYLVFAAAFGIDYWRLTAAPVQEGIKASIQISTQHAPIFPMPVVGTGSGSAWTAGAAPMSGTIVNGTALYELFWERMDYLLGKRKTWMTCTESNERVSKGIVWGLNEALCNSFNVDDKSPVEE